MTMKANELMIGDWVEVPFLEGKPKIVKVEEILFDEINPEWDGMENYGGIKIKYVEPIPLTSEILEKNGFHINGIPNSITSVKAIDDWSDDTYVWSRQETPDERMFVSVYIDDPANFFVEVYCQYCHVDGIHVKYLHQLQHTLKLCGIDKEIVL